MSGKTPTREKKNVTIQLPVEPAGIVAPPAVAQPVVQPAAIESPAASVLAAAVANDAPLAVPAAVVVDPNAPAHERTEKLHRVMKHAFEAFYRSRPLMGDLPAAVALLTDDQVEELGMQYKASQAALTPPVKVSLVAAFDHIRNENAVAITAAAKARGSQSPIDNAWVAAALGAIDGLRSDVAKLSTAKRPTVARSATTTDRKASGTNAEKSRKLLDYCAGKGLENVDLIDCYKAGYQGAFHCVRVHADGRYEKLDYNAETRVTTPTGEFVNNWKYFTSDKGEAPQYSLHQMYGILDPEQKLGRPGPTRATWATHLADIELVREDMSKAA